MKGRDLIGRARTWLSPHCQLKGDRSLADGPAIPAPRPVRLRASGRRQAVPARSGRGVVGPCTLLPPANPPTSGTLRFRCQRRTMRPLQGGRVAAREARAPPPRRSLCPSTPEPRGEAALRDALPHGKLKRYFIDVFFFFSFPF